MTTRRHAGCQDPLVPQSPRGSLLPWQHQLWVRPFHSCMDGCTRSRAGMWKQRIIKKNKRPSIIPLQPKCACATFLSAAKCFVSSSVYIQVGKHGRWSENKISSAVHIEEFRSCLQRSRVSVSGCSPETCFNSCVCGFGDTVPQGNISHFIASNKFYLIFSKLDEKYIKNGTQSNYVLSPILVIKFYWCLRKIYHGYNCLTNPALNYENIIWCTIFIKFPEL